MAKSKKRASYVSYADKKKEPEKYHRKKEDFDKVTEPNKTITLKEMMSRQRDGRPQISE